MAAARVMMSNDFFVFFFTGETSCRNPRDTKARILFSISLNKKNDIKHIRKLSKTAYPEEGCRMMEPIPASTEQGAGYILDKLPVYHRINANLYCSRVIWNVCLHSFVHTNSSKDIR